MAVTLNRGEVARVRELLSSMTGHEIDCTEEASPVSELVDLGDEPFARILSLIKVRERSSSELRRRLESEGFEREAVTAAVQRAMRCGLVDDARFAEVYVRSKIRAGWGRYKVERELDCLGVDPYLVEGYPEVFFSPDDELERALALLRKRSIPDKNPVEKSARYLAGKGFSSDLALHAARQWCSQDLS